jgi:hypothetical protein
MHQLSGRRAQEDRPGGCLLLEAHGQLGRRADRRVELLGVLPKPPDDHQARVQAHAHGEAAGGQRVHGRVLAQALVQIERRQHGASRMILLGHGRAKDGREAFTRQSRERAFVGLQHLLGQSNHRL